MNLTTGKITVLFKGESKETDLYPKKNGTFVYWSPFTGERVVVGKKRFRSPPKRLRASKPMWVDNEYHKLKRRLNRMDKLPNRPVMRTSLTADRIRTTLQPS